MEAESSVVALAREDVRAQRRRRQWEERGWAGGGGKGGGAGGEPAADVAGAENLATALCAELPAMTRASGDARVGTEDDALTVEGQCRAALQDLDLLAAAAEIARVVPARVAPARVAPDERK